MAAFPSGPSMRHATAPAAFIAADWIFAFMLASSSMPKRDLMSILIQPSAVVTTMLNDRDQIRLEDLVDRKR